MVSITEKWKILLIVLFSNRVRETCFRNQSFHAPISLIQSTIIPDWYNCDNIEAINVDTSNENYIKMCFWWFKLNECADVTTV